MPFIWNDHTFWDRYFRSVKYFTFILLPLILLSMVFWYLFAPKSTHWIHIVFVSAITGLAMYSFLGIFFLFPNANIPDIYHPVIKRLVYGFYFIVTLAITFFVASKFGLLGEV